MEDSTVSHHKTLNESTAIEITGKIMVVAIILLFLVVVFIFTIHIYAKLFYYRRRHDHDATGGPHNRRHRRRFNIAQSSATLNRVGLDPSVIKSIALVIFDPKEFKDGLECAICLSEVSEGEKTRILPKCNHGFHSDCIDMWFQSHSTCPICRNPISPKSSSSTSGTITNPQLELGIISSEPQNYPTNVLFWGDETQVSSYTEEHNPSPGSGSDPDSGSDSATGEPEVVVDIANEEGELKSPVTGRLRSFKRLLSWDSKVGPSTSGGGSNMD